MAFEQTLSFLGKSEGVSSAASREIHLTQNIYESVQRCRNRLLPLSERTHAWETALGTASDKYSVKLAVNQSLRPGNHQPIIDTSPILDMRILESYSPELKRLVETHQVHIPAAYTILEFFLRDRHHGLNPQQIEAVAKLFPPQRPNESFQMYKNRVDTTAVPADIPGKSSDETWIIRREVMDVLEITDHIEQKYLRANAGKKTISITDLIRIASNALHTIHEMDSRVGAQRVIQQDKELLASKQTPFYRDINKETALRALLHSPTLISMILSPQSRDFSVDFERILNLRQRVEVTGLEHLPTSGPVIVAFSHMNQWKDRTVAPNWDIAKMIQEIQRKRQPKNLALVAYIQYFKDIFPLKYRNLNSRLIESALQQSKRMYGIEFIDVSTGNRRGIDFVDQAKQALREGKAVLLSPEGVPASEVIKPHRGVGLLARTSGGPVVGVAFREELLSDGSFRHTVIFTPQRRYNTSELPGQAAKEKDQAFADLVMRDIAQQLPESQRGVFR